MDDLELSDLGHFHGTEGYHGVMGTNVTDGVAYIIENGYSWFVTDFLVVAKMNSTLKKQSFLSVKLKLDGTKGTMVVTDGNKKVLYKQEYTFTNAKTELDLFYTDNVLMLCGEY